MTWVRLIVASAGGILLAACETPTVGRTEDFYAVTSKQAQVYRFGPAQPTGADAVLTEGQKVRMLRKEFGYSRVMTEDGMTGYISNDFITPTAAPQRPKPGTPGNLAMPPPPLPSRGGGSPGLSSANRSILQTAPLFGGDDLPPLPDAEPKPAFRAAKPRPGFRFKVQAPTAVPAENP